MVEEMSDVVCADCFSCYAEMGACARCVRGFTLNNGTNTCGKHYMIPASLVAGPCHQPPVQPSFETRTTYVMCEDIALVNAICTLAYVA
jgi:hypothetical protein